MKKIVSIRIDPELYEKAKGQANLQNRNFSNFVETILKEYLQTELFKPYIERMK